VVGLAGVIHPLTMEAAVLTRDMAVMGGLTLALFVLGYGHRGQPGRINRWEGVLLMTAFAGYTGYLLYSTLGTTG
jgi:cation:H+ antiporter